MKIEECVKITINSINCIDNCTEVIHSGLMLGLGTGLMLLQMLAVQHFFSEVFSQKADLPLTSALNPL